VVESAPRGDVVATPKAKPKGGATLKPGWWVAVTLKPSIAPLRSYVGKIQAIDGHGIRLTLIDWMTRSANGDDLYIAHSNLECALVATEEHDLELFVEEAEKWATLMDRKPAEAAEG
jgi:hypothetical protein